MSEYKVILFNFAPTPPAIPAQPPYDKSENFATLEEARKFAMDNCPTVEIIKIYSSADDKNPVEEYRKGFRCEGGMKSPLNDSN